MAIVQAIERKGRFCSVGPVHHRRDINFSIQHNDLTRFYSRESQPRKLGRPALPTTRDGRPRNSYISVAAAKAS